MASIGLNVSLDGAYSPSFIRERGATWIRIVAHPDHDLREYFRRCRDAGLKILLVFARESGGNYARYRRLYGGLVDAVQAGNEADLESYSSWTMSQVELASLGRAVRAIFPRPFPLICSGMASGHPGWLDGMDLSWSDALGFHPYAKDAPNPHDVEDLPDVPGLLAGYQRYGLPLLITEWGWWDNADEGRATEEVRDMVGWAGRSGDLEVFFYFCASDAMVTPFGLTNADGRPKARDAAFREQAALAVHSLWPGEIMQPSEPRFVLGFRDWYDEDPDLIGEPLEDEHGPVRGMSAQQTTNGFLIWADGVGMVFKDTRDGRWHVRGAA